MKIAVIGGGASGIASAIYAKRENKENSVTVFERSDRILKKLLATGNGRCNLSNICISENNYFSSCPGFVKKVLSAFTPQDERQFFESLGILLTEENGRIYPYSRRANSVLDALRFECEHLGIKIRTNSYIDEVKKAGASFNICGELFDRVILSVGANAAPSFGTDGNGLRLLSQLDHSFIKFSDALSPVKVKENTKALKGIRARAAVSLCCGNEKIRTEVGEVQFTEYGLSGISVMQLSHLCKAESTLLIDLVLEYSENELFSMLLSRKKMLSHLNAEDFLTGFLHKSLSSYILSRVGISPKKSCADMSQSDLRVLTNTIKNLSFSFASVIGKEQSQASAGGALLEEFDPFSLESKKHKGLYCTGELLDAVGDCGGYNLHWAWATAHIAGKNAGGQND